jgi:hypothetical protein
MKARVSRTAIAVVSVLSLLALATPASGVVRLPARTSPVEGSDGSARSGGAKALPALAPVGDDALARALGAGSLSEAEYALQRARTLFRLADVRARFGDVAAPDPRDASMILRDLAVRQFDLGPAGRLAAHSILARPTDGAADPDGQGYTVVEATPICTSTFCVHYVASTADAPPPTDADLNGVPDFVDSAIQTMNEVWTAEVTTDGYRPPKSDLTSLTNGGSGLIDIYLAQLGDESLYGFCTTDDPNADPANGYRFWDLSAYCVVDNDFAAAEFPPPVSGVAALQVTAAHEFFHAIQFGYDAYEDGWLMEATATFMEDEVYTAVNDNLQYLPDSQLVQPDVPLDLNESFYWYGNWVFFRFLTEYVGVLDGTGVRDPSIVRRAWERADGSELGADQYSLQAVSNTVKDFGGNFRFAFADFALFNAAPEVFYEEGASYPAPRPSSTEALTPRHWDGGGFVKMDHLTSGYYAFRPGRGIPSSAKVGLWVDGPSYKEGTEASAAVFMTNGAVRFYAFSIDRFGYGYIKVPFGKGKVRSVVLIPSNASRRTTCWVDPTFTYSCGGDPRDDRGGFSYGAILVGLGP